MGSMELLQPLYPMNIEQYYIEHEHLMFRLLKKTKAKQVNFLVDLVNIAI